MSDHREIVVAASALSMLFASQADAQAQGERRGVAGYVRGNVQAIPADGTRAVRVRVGDPIFENQRIVTDRRSRMHVMMVDKSSITIGPNSDLTIDKYEYKKEDPTVGQMVLSSAKGLFRFVGGLLSKRNPIRVRTPVATIGIRGAVAFVQPSENGLKVTFFYGDEVTVESASGSIDTINQPGFFLDIDGDGRVSTGRSSAQDIAALAGQVGGSDGSTEVGSSTDTAGTSVVEIDTDSPIVDLQGLSNALRSTDTTFDSDRAVLQQLNIIVGGSSDIGAGG